MQEETKAAHADLLSTTMARVESRRDVEERAEQGTENTNLEL